MNIDDAIQTMADEFVKTLQHSILNGSMWIYPGEPDEDNRTICALAYSAASIDKVTIEPQGSHSVVRLVT